MEKHKKIAFIISVVLFVLFLPFTVLGIVYHVKNGDSKNPNHEFHYNDKLYFYNNANSLIGTYDCNYENCGYGEEIIEDETYGINYFKMVGLETKALINNRFAIISDYYAEKDGVIIYDIINKTKSDTYAGYKIYTVGIANNYVIVKTKDEKYGVLQLNDSIQTVIEPTYEFIGLQNAKDVEQNKIASDLFIVKKENTWNLIDSELNKKTSDFVYPITAFNDNSIIVQNQTGTYSLKNYDGTSKLSSEYKKIKFLGNYIEVVDQSNNYSILNKDNFTRVSQIYQITDESVIATRINETSLEIVIDNEVKETIDIS
ncbi:MAG: hypothetical protein E7158_05455 [Firmicutes bacterium]|nr:hypothetical protein [Bacillota bacterium]